MPRLAPLRSLLPTGSLLVVALGAEAGRTLMRPVEAALEAAAERVGAGSTDELAHLLLFFTAGDLVWRAEPGYPTVAGEFGIWAQHPRAGQARPTGHGTRGATPSHRCRGRLRGRPGIR